MRLLDLGPLFESYSASGSDPIRPDLMLAVVLIEMREGRRRPSQWHKDAQRNDPLKWAGFGIRPSRTSWYNFRDRLRPFLDGWFREVLEIAKRLDVTPGTRGAIDGSLVAANASRHRLLNEERLDKRIVELALVCQQHEKRETPGEVPAWMAKTEPTRLEQYERYQRAKDRLEEFHAVNQRQNPARRRPREKIVVSPTDPEAALGPDKLKVFRPLYNVQLVSDLDSSLTLGYGVFAQHTDAGTLGPMLQRLSAVFGVELEDLLGDSTYITGCNLAISQQREITLFGPWQENDHSDRKQNKTPNNQKKEKQIPKEAFQWLPGENQYRCPQGHLLSWIGKEKRVQIDGEINVMHRYRCLPRHCRACPLSASCTKNPDRGRAVKRSEHEDLIEAHRARMATQEAKQFYRLRKQTVELGYADAKENRALHRFSGRSRKRAAIEFALGELVRNMLIVERFSNRPTQTRQPALSAYDDTS
jgi:hypothetical protein